MLRRDGTGFPSADAHGRLCAADWIRIAPANRIPPPAFCKSVTQHEETAMTTRYIALCAATVLAAVALQGTSAHALSMTECSAKYKAAKTAGTLNGMKWNDFRKVNCGSDATAAPAAAAPATASAPAAAPAPAVAPAAAPVATGSAVFPSAVDSKYSKDSAGKARRETCLDQYNANKAGNGNGGLKWIMKGGGYYSQCNKKLKGA
jgi:hypothetical protein